MQNTIKKLDLELPIVASRPISRAAIFDQLWQTSAENIAKRFLSQTEYKAVQSLSWLVVEQKIGAIANILAHVLSKKKPKGLASDSKNNSTDRVLTTLQGSLERLNTVKPNGDVKQFHPNFENDFISLKQQHLKLIADYKILSSREARLITNVVKSFSDLKLAHGENFYSEDEIKSLIQESIEYFKANNFKIFNDFKSLTRLMRENIDSDEYFGSGHLVRKKSKKKKSTKELRELEKTGSRKLRLYPDKI